METTINLIYFDYEKELDYGYTPENEVEQYIIKEL